jgi:DNA processing protein
MSEQLTDEQRIDWLRLIRSENVGPRTFRALLNQYGGAAVALAALPGLARFGGRGVLRIPTRAEAEAEIAAAAKIGVRLVALGEAEYPSRLREIDDAPPLLAIQGNGAVLAEPAVAIVGARNASAAGMRFAGELARRTRCGRFCRRLRPRPRHRFGRTPRQPLDRHDRSAGGRPRQALSP